MKTTANVSTVELSDGRQVCLSYGVIVAAFIPRGWCPQSCDGSAPSCTCYPALDKGYLRTDARYSVTTSRHMNQFAGRDSAIVPDVVLKALCAPVTSK